MRILIAEKLSQCGVDALEAAGHSVVTSVVTGDALCDAVAELHPNVLVVRSTKVTAAIIAVGRDLELIVRAGAGYDTIDVDAASGRGIYVVNCPGRNAAAVAELTVGLICALDRRLVDNVVDARAGVWNKAKYSKAAGLAGQTLGVIGSGNIAREVITRAHGLHLTVVAWSRSLTPEKAAELGVGYEASLLAVARKADIVSLHVAATADTHHLANREFFEAMKPGAMFINTTRGSVVDEAALLWALDHRGLRAGLDVFENEPSGKDGPCDLPLARHPNVYLTHHIGASTDQAQDATALEAARVINKYAAEAVADNCVNRLGPEGRSHSALSVRHLNKPGVLAGVLAEIRNAGWNVKEISNVVFAGEHAACARIGFETRDSSADPSDVQRAVASVPNVLVAVATVVL
jgi:D-3-phosphoglycerate dehydrogenase